MKRYAALFIVALAARLAFVWHQGAPAPLAGDALEYHAYAESLASQGRYEGVAGSRGTRMPGYPLFLAAVYSAAGPSPRAAVGIQCLLGALTCLLLVVWARRLLPEPWPWACGWAAVFYYDLVAPCASLLTEALTSLLLTAALVCAERCTVRAGLLLGLLCLVRAEMLPFALLLPFVPKGVSRRRALTGAGMVVLVAGIWAGRNAMVFGRFTPASTVGGFNLYMGLRLPLEHQPMDLGPRHRPPAEMDELARDKDFLAAYGRLRERIPAWRTAKAFLFNLLSAYYPFLPGYDWTYALLIPFWLAGMGWALARREFWPPAGCVLWLSAVYTFFGGPVSRYRFGFSPCLILLAALGASELQRRLPPSWLRAGAAAWAAANLAVWAWAPQLRQGLLWLKSCLLR